MKTYILTSFLTLICSVSMAQTTADIIDYGDVKVDFSRPDTVVITGRYDVNDYGTEFLGYKFTEDGAENIWISSIYDHNNKWHPKSGDAFDPSANAVFKTVTENVYSYTQQTQDDLLSAGYIESATLPAGYKCLAKVEEEDLYFVQDNDGWRPANGIKLDISWMTGLYRKNDDDTYTFISIQQLLDEGYIEVSSTKEVYIYTAEATNAIYYKGAVDWQTVYLPVEEGQEYKNDAYTSEVSGTQQATVPTDVTEMQNNGYICSLYKAIWPDVAAEINERYPDGGFAVIVKPEDTSAPMVIGNTVTQHLLTTKVASLDLSKVYIPQIDTPFDRNFNATGSWTFGIPNDNWGRNESLTKLLMPNILLGKEVDMDYHYHVPSMVCWNLPNLEYVAMPKNATCIEPYAFANKQPIHYAIFNEGLRMIGENAFNSSRFNVLTFPTTIEYIGKDAFCSGFLHDAYFFGEKAPIVEMDAFGSKAYLNNNAINDHEPDLAFKDQYRACRENYINYQSEGTYMAAMLHLPEGISDARRAAYTDVTRDYHVFGLEETRDGETLVINSSDVCKEFRFDSNGAMHIAYACDGDPNNTSAVTSKGNFEVSCANILDIGGYNEMTGEYDIQSYIKTSGYYDKYVGQQYHWPSQEMMNRSYAVATNNLLWDGHTSIGQGLINATGENAEVDVCYDTDCDGIPDKCFEDGAQYIGLHQFVLVNYDLDDDTTPEEYPFPTVQGANWYTICVPLHVTAGEVRKVFGKYTQVCRFNKVERDPSDKLKLYFTEETCLGKEDSELAIVGNHPYMIRPSRYKDADHVYVLPDYMIQTPEIVVPETLNAVDKNGVETGHLYTFIGQYKTRSNGDKLCMNMYDYYLGLERDTKGNIVYDNVMNKNDDGTDDLRHIERHRLFLQGGTTGKWKPFTCVVFPSDGVRNEASMHGYSDYSTFFTTPATRVKGTSGAFGTSDLNDGEEDEMPTSIPYEIYCGTDPEPVNVYGLDGRYLGTSAQSLPKGVYVKQGKKFIAR